MPDIRPDPLALLPKVPTFKLESPQFEDGGTLPLEAVFNGFGLEGGNQSPALHWSGFPEGARSFLVQCYDPDAPTISGFWHWCLADVPAGVTALDAGAGSGRGLQGGLHLRNDYGMRDYGGAAPPSGHAPHRYIFIVHALGAPSLGLDENASAAYATYAAGYSVLGRATLTARFGRSDSSAA